ncbi:hypothetical protein KCP73_15880 [Salmonella enterica subsp. enterica]|nr:hypothetical protein KCP73_15880 [Salmonella enterica subsp. enterica]
MTIIALACYYEKLAKWKSLALTTLCPDGVAIRAHSGWIVSAMACVRNRTRKS